METTERTAALSALMSLHTAILTEKRPAGRGRAPLRGEANRALTYVLCRLIEHGARFDVGDFAEIKRLGAYSTNGSFEPLSIDVYARALSAGNGSAADAWEHAANVRGWPWPGTQLVPACERLHADDAYLRPNEIVMSPLRRVHPRGRLCINTVWWRVYKMNADELRLAAYPGDNGSLQVLPTKGVRRITYTRETWAQIVDAERAAQKSGGVA